MVINHHDFMTLALAASMTNKGHTWPNPSVGCVLVKNNQVIATGCTQIGGRPHAEIDALTKAGDAARGSVAYVTLEPCNHISDHKPMSCCHGLIESGVKTVVIAQRDPDPRMAGNSIQLLKNASIEVIETNDAVPSLTGYLTKLKTGRPRVTLKLAHSRDGKIGTIGGHVGITGPETKTKVYAMRAHSDAVMIGINTVMTDDPQLTDRRDCATHQPARIIVDRHARLPLTSKLIKEIHHAPVWILCDEDADTTALENAGAYIVTCPTKNDKIDMTAALHILGNLGLTDILCEGGAKLAQSLLDQNLVDDAYILEGPNDIGATGIALPHIHLPFQSEEKIGADIWRFYKSK